MKSEYDKKLKRYRFYQKQTKSALQTAKFFEDFIRKEKVANFIKEYRKFLGLPKDGLPLTQRDIKEFEDCMIPAFFLPKKVKPFWIKKGKKEGIRIINTCKAFVGQELGVESIYVEMMLRNFLVFNKIIKIPQEIFYIHHQDDLVKLEPLRAELSWYDAEDHYLLKCMYEHFDYVAKKFPIAIYISPEATQNQIKDFISKNWADIKIYQDDKKKLSGIRNKRRQKVNDFIYSHRHLPYKKISSLVADNFPKEISNHIDEGSIGKIISIEKKRRK